MQLFGTLTSESGNFTHIGGNLLSFQPHPDNVIAGGVDAPQSHSDKLYHYDYAIKTFIVPEGIKHIPENFMVNRAVTTAFKLPETLISIGAVSASSGSFVRCFLPEVVLPAGLQIIGDYVFGGSYMRKLVVNPANKSKYGRQFKDSVIEELYLPKAILHSSDFDLGNDYGFYANFSYHCRCTIIEY